MAAWRIAVRRLHALGGVATCRQISDFTYSCEAALRRAAALGLVSSPGRGGHDGVWTITERGIQLVEGAIDYVRMGPRRGYFKVNWFTALPSWHRHASVSLS